VIAYASRTKTDRTQLQCHRARLSRCRVGDMTNEGLLGRISLHSDHRPPVSKMATKTKSSHWPARSLGIRAPAVRPRNQVS